MKIIFFTDNMGSGGAQRQLSMLAVLLKKRGHDVTVITYNHGDFFEYFLEKNKINRIRIESKFKWRRPIEFAKILHKLKPHGVIAFQRAPSFYAELASLLKKNWQLIVSERSSVPSNQKNFLGKSIRLLHVIADVVTTNSHTNRLMIENTLKALRRKTVTIYNAVELDKFKPITGPSNQNILRFIVLSSHKFGKNFEGLAHAVALLKKETGLPQFKIDWFGDEAPGWLTKDKELCQKYEVDDIIQFYPSTDKVIKELDQSDALILSSLWEGLPNAVCEALSTGCPVLMSDVCDARNLVTERKTGFLFNPLSPQSIAEAMRQFLYLPINERQAMREAARLFAERLFDSEYFAVRYEQLLQGHLLDPSTGLRHWPPQNLVMQRD